MMTEIITAMTVDKSDGVYINGSVHLTKNLSLEDVLFYLWLIEIEQL